MGSRASAVVAILVGVAAATVTSPVALATTLWVGGGAITSGIRASAPTYAVVGVVIVAIASLVVIAWASIPGIVRGRRRPAVVALVTMAMIGALALSRAWHVVVAPWVPRPVALAAMAAALIGLVVLILRGRSPGQPVVGVAPAAAGVIGAYVVVAAVAALPSSSIPQFPRPPWVPDLVGEAAVGDSMPGLPAPRNPALAPGEWSTIHNDGWMTDAYAGVRMLDPGTAGVSSFFAGGDCASLVWNAAGDIVSVCVSPTEVRAYILDPGTLKPLAERRLASRPIATDALTNFSGGGYAVLDAAQRLVTPLPGGIIGRFDGGDLAPVDEFDVTGALQPGEGITSVVPDWSGALWFVGREGSIGVLDPSSGESRALLAGPAGAPVDIENSFAVIEGGGAYVVTGADLLRLDIVEGSPVVTWRMPYDRGVRLKPGQTSRASGTTPTVFGDAGRFVAFTDNADPRMHVVVIDASGPVPVEHCKVPVFGDGESATENSLIAMGDSLIVESNYGYSVTAVAGGHSTVPGLARVDVTLSGCDVAWETQEVTIPSLVSKGVMSDGAVLTYTKEPSLLGVDAWWFTSVDAGTGKVQWRRLAGVGPLLNNHYAAGYVAPDGSVYVGTISGVVALTPRGDASVG